MTFSRRLTLYLFGFLIGLAMVFVFFGDRLNFFTDWFPNNRVLAILREDEIELSEKAGCQMTCLNLDESIIENTLKNGDVDFGESNPQADPRLYVISVTQSSGQSYQLRFETRETTSIVTSITLAEGEDHCDCP